MFLRREAEGDIGNRMLQHRICENAGVVQYKTRVKVNRLRLTCRQRVVSGTEESEQQHLSRNIHTV